MRVLTYQLITYCLERKEVSKTIMDNEDTVITNGVDGNPMEIPKEVKEK